MTNKFKPSITPLEDRTCPAVGLSTSVGVPLPPPPPPPPTTGTVVIKPPDIGMGNAVSRYA